MSQLARLEGKHTTQNTHCALVKLFYGQLPSFWCGGYNYIRQAV